jgi:predicted RNA-binding protein with PIN domain
MPILIDGHNLVGKLPVLSLQDPDDEQRLIELLRSYQARTGKEVTVVFDPGETFALAQARFEGRVQVVFAPHGSSADSVIARRIRRAADPRGWLVVTSDRQLARTVMNHGARVLDAEAFSKRLLPSSTDESSDWKDEPPSSDEVAEWLTLFDERDD